MQGAPSLGQGTALVDLQHLGRKWFVFEQGAGAYRKKTREVLNEPLRVKQFT